MANETILELDLASDPSGDAGNWTPSSGVNIWAAPAALQFYVNSNGNRFVSRDIDGARVGEEHTLTISIESASSGWSVTAGNVTEPLETSGDTVVVFTATSGDVTVTLHKQTAVDGDWINVEGLVVVAEVSPPAPTPEPVAASGWVRLEDRSVPATSWVTTADGPASATLWVSVNGVVADPTKHTIDSLLADSPFWVAHRCGGGNWPEFSMRGADNSVARGYKALELSVYETADQGVFVCSHDWNTSRMTGVSHGIPLTPWSTLSALTSTAEYTSDPSQSRTPLMRLDEVVAKYGQSHVLFIDHKETSLGNGESNPNKLAQEERLLDYLDTIPNGTDRIVWKVFAPATASRARAAARGYRSWGIYYATDMAAHASHASDFDILGLEWNAAQVHWDTLKATGKKVIAHIVGTQSQVNGGTSRGADGFMCSAPASFGPPPPTTPPPPAPHKTVVGIYNGTELNADNMFYNALGSALGAGTSYYTHNARQGGVFVLREWDTQRINRGYVPYIHFQSVGWNSSVGADVQYYPWKDVADGLHDAVFVQWANALKDCPPGTAFSFDGEPEVRLESGSHQPVPNPNSPKTWPSGWPQNGDGKNTPAHYAAAQRRIYDIMHPIAPNVDYRFWFAGHLRNSYMESFYPGDAYVDSIAIDPYVWSWDTTTVDGVKVPVHPRVKYKPIVDWLRSRSWGQGKPIGISETGIDVSHGDAQMALFWSRMPDLMQELKISWLAFYNRSNWYISQSSYPLAWAAYVAAMKKIAGTG